MSLGRVQALEALRRLLSGRLGPAASPPLCRPLSGAGPTSPQTQTQEPAGQTQQRPAKNTSKAMMAYLERATKHGQSVIPRHRPVRRALSPRVGSPLSYRRALSPRVGPPLSYRRALSPRVGPPLSYRRALSPRVGLPLPCVGWQSGLWLSHSEVVVRLGLRC